VGGGGGLGVTAELVRVGKGRERPERLSNSDIDNHNTFLETGLPHLQSHVAVLGSLG